VSDRDEKKVNEINFCVRP